jgi:hypothetical protein
MAGIRAQQAHDAAAYIRRTVASGAAVDDAATKVDWEPADIDAEAPRWPAPLETAAYHGLAGEFVRVVSPASESDPASLLISFLVGVGSLVGRHVYYQVERDRHYCNLFALIVGATGHARKGSSWGWVNAVLQLADPRFAVENVKGGLSSGEGLIHHVRDAAHTPTRAGKMGHPAELDPGVRDKRLLVYESEFARVIAVLRKDGNTLSATIRQAWDSGSLATLTKFHSERATGAHVAFIGHITPTELRRSLETVALTNGFANRFLFVAARKSKDLPDGGDVRAGVLENIAAKLRKVVEWASAVHRLEMTSGARARWHLAYCAELNDPKVGELLEAAVSRAAPQVLRLASVYAVLDRSPRIDVGHLEGALAVWRYCFGSAAFLLGLATGNPVADTILTAIETVDSEGLTRTQISELFSNNKGKNELDNALRYLQERGKAHRRPAKPQLGKAGRPAERWYRTKETVETGKSTNSDSGDRNTSFSSFSPSLSDDAYLADERTGIASDGTPNDPLAGP